MKFEVKCVGSYYIAPQRGEDYREYYLHKDGTLHDTCDRNKGYWSSKAEAQEFLDSWLPQKDWITKEQVKEAAEISDECAHACSINHWKQIVLASDEEYLKANQAYKVSMKETFCSLCKRHFNKNTVCTLSNSMCNGPCVSEWYDAKKGKKEQIAMLNKLIETYNEHFKKEKKMDTNLDARIEQNRQDQQKLRDEEQRLLKEKKEKEKYIFKYGDVAENKYGEVRIIVNTPAGLLSINHFGNWENRKGQWSFENLGYKKIGELKDYL